MNIDPGIVKFNHCRSTIFCQNLPLNCPICHNKLEKTIIPVRLQYPFVRACQHTCSILIKPSSGNFLHEYSCNANGLHIGITDSRGQIFEYDENGIEDSKTETWNECILIYEMENNSHTDRWDKILTNVVNTFTEKRYSSKSNNCYSFVISFIQEFNVNNLSHLNMSKERFCKVIIIPKLKNALKYVMLFRKTQKHKYFINS